MKRMRRLHRAYCQSSKFVKRNSTTIMTIGGCVGFVATIILAAQAVPKARELLDEAEMKKGDGLTKVEIVTVVAPAYSKAVITGVSTMSLILGADFLNRKQKASMIGAYTALQKLYNEHRDKVGELFGADANDIIDREKIKDKKSKYKTDELGEKEFWFYIPEFDVRFKSTEKQVILGEYHFNRNYALRGYADVKELLEFLQAPPIEYGTSIGWSMDIDYDLNWIDFEHKLEGDEYIIWMPFAPTADYMECEFEY